MLVRSAVAAVALLAAGPALAAGRGLIVAIGDYPIGGYPDINAVNDVDLVRSALALHGIHDVDVLQDEQATKVGIEEAFARLAARVEPGDTVVVHYSGHGHRIADDNREEPDGYDEVLVPYDAPFRPGAGYAGEGHLRDDWLGRQVGILRDRAGAEGHVLVTLDACHSGSGYRLSGPGPRQRGVEEPLGPPAASPPTGVEAGGGVDVSAGAATFTFLSAARHDQLAMEAWLDDRPVGSLSLTLSRALARTGPKMTYRALFADITEQMDDLVPGQVPQLEGDRDVTVLGGAAVAQAGFYTVTGEGTEVTVAGGTLHAILPGAEVELHPRGTAEPTPATRLATGTVTASSTRSAEVHLAVASPVDPAQTWAFVTRYAGPDLRITVSGPGAAELVKGVGIAVAVPRGELEVQPRGGVLHLVRASDDTVLASGDASALRARMVDYSRATYLRRLSLFDASIDVRVVVTPIDGSGVPLPADAYLTAGGQTSLQPGDLFQLTLEHRGTRNAYVSVLDLTPDGRVGQLYPLAEAGHDNVLEPGAVYPVPGAIFRVDDVLGTEVVKVVATRRPVDFAWILSPDRPTTRAADPLSLLLADVSNGVTTRLPGALDGSTHDAILRIVAARSR